MLQGLNHIHQAVELLVGRSISLDERFHEAATEFVAAVSQSDDWPVKLLDRACAIKEALTIGGSVDSGVRELDPVAAERIADEILDIAEAITTYRAERPTFDGYRDDLNFSPTTYRIRRVEKGSKKWRGRVSRYCHSEGIA